MYVQNYGLHKTCLDKWVKIPISKDPWTSKMVKGPKYCLNLNDSTFTIVIDHIGGVELIELQKVSLSDMQNLKTVY